MSDLNQSVYDKFASAYHFKRNAESESLWNEYLDRPMILDLLSSIPVGSSILDFGCGSGVQSSFIQNLGYNVTGVDFSEGLIQIAREELPDIPFHISDIRNTPFKDQSFDVLVSALVLHYIEDLSEVFEEVARLLIDQGSFIFSIHHPFNEILGRDEDKNIKLEPYFKGFSYKWTMLDQMELVSYHHTFEDIVTSANDAGIVVERIVEAKPEKSLADKFPDFYKLTSQIPTFCGFRIKKI